MNGSQGRLTAEAEAMSALVRAVYLPPAPACPAGPWCWQSGFRRHAWSKDLSDRPGENRKVLIV